MFVQKIKKSIFNLLVLAQLVAPLPAYAGGDPSYNKPLTRDEVLAASGNLLIDTLNKNGDSINIKWIQGQFKAQSEGGTLFDIKAFSVIKEYENQVFFTQYGFSNNENSNAANVGLGFYHLISPSIMIGGNVFYDAQTANSSPENTSRSLSDSIHQRYSVGGTIMTSQAGAFFNIYRGISKGMTDYTVADGLGQYEVSDGYDFGVNGLVPGYESINLGITQYKFNEESQGSKFKVEYKPNSVFTFGVEQDQSDTPSSSLYIATKYAFDTSLEEQLKPVVQAYSGVWSKRYDEVERDNKITLEYAKQGVVVTTVPAAVWGDSVQIPTPTGGGTGKITYMIKESVQQNAYGEGEEEEKENIEVSGTGLVTGVKTPQTVVVEVSRAADTSYSASSVDVSIKFGKRDAELNIDENENEGDEAVIPAKEWGQNIDIPEPNIGIPDPTGNGTSKFEYTLTDRGNTDVELEVNESGVGAVLKNAKGPGKVLVTVTRLGDDLYDESTLNISTEFTPKDEEMSLSEEATAEWGTGVALKSFITGGGTGKIELTLEEENGTSATVDELGDNIIGAKQSGTVTVKAVRETDGKFLTSEKEFQVVFTKQDIELEIADIASKKLGEAISLVDKVSIKDKDPKDPSRFRYELIADENLAEAELIEGVVSNAQRGGTVGVRVIRDTDDQYLETFKDVTVTFDLLVEDITVNNLPSELQWGSDFNLKKYITSGGEGTISYSVASDSEVNPSLDPDNGAITDMTEPGTVIVKVSRVKSLTHAAHEITVPVTFGLQIPRLAKTMDITGVKYGSTANIKNNINLTNLASENLPKAALLYLSSDTAIATVSREGIVSLTSGASLPNLVVITVTSPKDDKYDLVSESITVNFVKAGGNVTVDPIDSTPWSESGINISEKVNGAGDGDFKYTIEADDVNNTAVAVFDDGFLKATQSGIVRFKVTQKGTDKYDEATSDLVTVQFQKQEAIIKEISGSGRPSATTVVTGSLDISSYFEVATTANPFSNLGGLTYYEKSDSANGTYSVSAEGVVTSSIAQTVNVIVRRADSEKYTADDLDITVNFVKAGGNVTVNPIDSIPWSASGLDISGQVNGAGDGDFKYTIEADDVNNTAVAVFDDGFLKATQSGIVRFKVTQKGTDKYDEATSDLVTVQFQKQDIELEIADIASKKLGEAISLVDKVSIKDKDPKDPSRFRYELIADENLAEAELIEGVVSNAQRGGTVGVRVIRDTDDQYLETFKDVTVTFDLLVEDITVNNLPSELQWGSDFNLKKYITSGGEGVISYSVASDSEVNPTLDADNGAITDMTEPGTVIVKVSRVKSLTHAAHEITVPVTFGLQIPRLAKTMDITGVKHGSTANIKNNINLTNLASENLPKAALLYLSSDTAIATVSREGIVSLTSGASLPNLVVITVTSPKDDKYDLVSESITVNFVKAGGDVTVDPIDSTPWSESGINISEKVKGTGNGVFKYTIEAGDGNNTAGAVFDGGVLKATQRGIVRFKVTQEEGVNNTEATSDLVTVQFQKQEAIIEEITDSGRPDTISLALDSVDISSYFQAKAKSDSNVVLTGLTYHKGDSADGTYSVGTDGVVTSSIAQTVNVIVRHVDEKYTADDLDITVEFVQAVGSISVDTIDPIDWNALTGININSKLDRNGDGEVTYDIERNTAKAGFSGHTLIASQEGVVTFRATQAGTDKYTKATSELTTVVFNRQGTNVRASDNLPTTISLASFGLGSTLDLSPYFKAYADDNPNVALVGSLVFSSSSPITGDGKLIILIKQDIAVKVVRPIDDKYTSSYTNVVIRVVD